MQLTKNVHGLRITFPIPISPDRTIERFVYVYLILAERIWLIDTGVAAAQPVIFDYIRSAGRDVKEIAGIVLTHSHPDHIGAAKAIQKATGCTIIAHAAERNWIEDADLQAKERPVPGFHSLVLGSVRVDRTVAEGDTIELENGPALEVIETPGHSRGSISLLLREQGVLFPGDAVPVPGELPIYEDAAASAASVRKLRSIEGIRFLLSSWDIPREGQAAYESLDRGMDYLNRIHQAVLTKAGSGTAEDAMVLCRQLLEELGLPPAMANPLVARSFQADLSARERQADGSYD